MTLHPVVGKAKSDMICRAFAEGAPKSATGAVFYGVDVTNRREWQNVPGDFYYIDNSYFDCVRGQQYRVTKNGVQTLVGDQTSDGKRFDALGLTIRPMHPGGVRRVLAVEQSETFMTYVAQDLNWLERHTVAQITDNRTVITRRWAPDKLKLQMTLKDDLADVDAVLTHSSAAAVTAALRGYPTYVSELSSLFRMEPGDRQRYAGVLADNQWTLDEIRAGKAWSWLNK